MSQYAISKLYNVLFTVGLNNLINKNSLNNVKTASLHPGYVLTNFGSDNLFGRCVILYNVIDIYNILTEFYKLASINQKILLIKNKFN